MRQIVRAVSHAVVLLSLLAGCVMVTPTPAVSRSTPLPAAPANPPPVIEYDLGNATLIQARFPEDSRFRNMPVRLNGLVAVPAAGQGPFPVVVILHGTHPGCPVDEMGVDRWPCDPEVERPNYRGFAYLVSALADQGYVVLAPNINAENTFGFGEPTPGERLRQLLDLHLQALDEAANGGANAFGVELAGRADLARLALLGHSRGGEAAVALARGPALTGEGQVPFPWPVTGVLLIASAVTSVDPWTGSDVPMAVILSACDADVTTQDGQFFYEGARLAPQQVTWATSVWLERANHNAFNTTLPGDPFGLTGRPDCTTLLEPEDQRTWLVNYASDFLRTRFSQDPPVVAAARARMGLDELAPAPDELYDLPARVASLVAAGMRQTLMVPAAADELTIHRLGGAVTAEGVATHFCPKEFYSAVSLPGSEPCRRDYVTIPGQPSHAVVSWEQPGAVLRFALPENRGDLSGYRSLSLRAAVDPASPLNADGSPQAFGVRLTDRAGNSATLPTRPDEPALVFPPGTMHDDPATATRFFTGLVPFTTLRFPLRGFAGVDLTDIAEVALVFDQTPSGTLFVGDIETIR